MTVVVFKSKTEVFSFMERARRVGIGGKAVATPKEIKIGCGLAVAIADNYAMSAWGIIRNGDFQTFYGIFKIKRNGLKSTLTRVV